MSATLRVSHRPDRALFSCTGATTITNAAMTNADFTLAAGTHAMTVTVDGVTKLSLSGITITDGHVYQLPRIGDRDSGTTAGAVSQVI